MVNREHNVPDMILIGATARNSGKTTLAAAIITRYKLSRRVIALKVTTLHDENGEYILEKDSRFCLNPGEKFEIVEEQNPDSDKDTSLLLAAGAEKVYWLRSLRGYLYEGFEAFISMVPKNVLIVCESNSLRGFVNPGVFIMIKKTGNSQIKKSAAEVMDRADIVIEGNISNNFKKITGEIDKRIN